MAYADGLILVLVLMSQVRIRLKNDFNHTSIYLTFVRLSASTSFDQTCTELLHILYYPRSSRSQVKIPKFFLINLCVYYFC